jgi:hypothetical protein
LDMRETGDIEERVLIECPRADIGGNLHDTLVVDAA